MDAKLIDSQDNYAHMSTGFPNFGGVKDFCSSLLFPFYIYTGSTCMFGSRHVGKSERVSKYLITTSYT